MMREHEEIALDYDTRCTGDRRDTNTLPTTQPIASAYNKPAQTHMSLVKFLSEHSPQTIIPPALNYQVTWINNRVVGYWICIQCS